MSRLIDVREAVVHKPMALSVTIGGTPRYQLRVRREDTPVDFYIDQMYDLAVDRFVNLVVVLYRGLEEGQQS